MELYAEQKIVTHRGDVVREVTKFEGLQTIAAEINKHPADIPKHVRWEKQIAKARGAFIEMAETATCSNL